MTEHKIIQATKNRVTINQITIFDSVFLSHLSLTADNKYIHKSHQYASCKACFKVNTVFIPWKSWSHESDFVKLKHKPNFAVSVLYTYTLLFQSLVDSAS